MVIGIFTLLGSLFGGLITYFLQKQKFEHEFKILQENNKTEFIAESTIKQFLMDENYTDRTFSKIEKHLGGFEPDELRKLLVRSGAIRIYNENNEEFWRLLKEN